MPFGAILGPVIAAGLSDIGLAVAPAVASTIGGVVGGAGFGAALSGITGGDPLLGALGGGVGGGISDIAGPLIGDATGLGTTASDALGGALGGVASSAIQGGNPLTGAAMGAGGALVGDAVGLGGSSAPSGSGAGVGEAATAAPTLGGPTAGGGAGAASMAGPSASSASSVTGLSSAGSTVPTMQLAGAYPASLAADMGLPVDNSLAPVTGGSATPGGSAPASATGGGGMDFGSGGDATITTVPSTGGGFLSNLFGGGTPAGTMSATDAAGNPVSPTSPNAVSFGGGSDASGGVSAALSKLLGSPGTLLGGALLGGSLLFGNNSIPGLGAVEGQAAQESALGSELTQGLRTGAVPPGAQAILDQTAAQEKAKIRSNYASLGLTGSSMEAQDLASVDQHIAGQKWNIINSLLGPGMNAMGMANTLDLASMNAKIQQDQAMQSAIARFAAALAGGFGGKAAA